jgi:hypothetical protein
MILITQFCLYQQDMNAAVALVPSLEKCSSGCSCAYEGNTGF